MNLCIFGICFLMPIAYVTVPVFVRGTNDFYDEHYPEEDVKDPWTEVLATAGVSEGDALEIGCKLIAEDLTPDRIRGVLPHTGHVFVAEMLARASLSAGEICVVVKAISENKHFEA